MASSNSSQHNNSAVPSIYVLDLGVGAEFDQSKGFSCGKVLTMDADGSNLKTLVDNITSPDGIDVSISTGRIFWTSMGIPGRPDGGVLSAKLDGTDVRTLTPNGAVNTAKQLVIDHGNSKLYFCDREGLRVIRCNFDGSDFEVLVQTGDWERDGFQDQTKWCVGIAVDVQHGHIYWTQKGGSKAGEGRIFRAGITIPTNETATSRSDVELLFDHLPEPIDLEIDSEQQMLYWTDRGEYPFGNTLNTANVGSNGDKKPVTLARHFHEAIGMKVDKINRHIYVADLGGAVYRFDMDGSNKQRILDTDSTFTGIAIAHSR